MTVVSLTLKKAFYIKTAVFTLELPEEEARRLCSEEALSEGWTILRLLSFSVSQFS